MSIFVKSGLAVMLSVFLTFGSGAGSPQSEELRIDAASSKMFVHVGRSGLFAFAGHDHEVIVPAIAGGVMLDRTDVSRSRLSVQFDATAMKVTGKGEPPEDVPEVQQVMLGERVLDVARHPKIGFVSEDVSVVQRSADRMSLRINGQLTLRGVARRVTVSTEVRLTGDSLTATGKATVRQTDFGIRPVTAGGGTVKVKDEVEIEFTIVARPAK